MKHLLVIVCLFFTSVYSDGKRDRDSTSKNETYSFMVAMVKYKEDGQKKLCTSTKPVKGYNYFVTNETGYIIGDVESFEKDSTETCEGWMTIWNLNILNLRSSDIINSYQYLIIKTKTDFSIKFREDFTKLCQIPVDILLKLTGIPEIKSSSSSMTVESQLNSLPNFQIKSLFQAHCFYYSLVLIKKSPTIFAGQDTFN